LKSSAIACQRHCASTRQSGAKEPNGWAGNEIIATLGEYALNCDIGWKVQNTAIYSRSNFPRRCVDHCRDFPMLSLRRVMIGVEQGRRLQCVSLDPW